VLLLFLPNAPLYSWPQRSHLHIKHTKRKNEKLIRNRKDFTRVEGQKKDGVKFRNPELHRLPSLCSFSLTAYHRSLLNSTFDSIGHVDRLNEDYKKFNRSYEQKQAQIVASVVATAGNFFGSHPDTLSVSG